jgi:hypothetical protein
MNVTCSLMINVSNGIAYLDNQSVQYADQIEFKLHTIVQADEKSSVYHRLNESKNSSLTREHIQVPHSDFIKIWPVDTPKYPGNNPKRI